VDDGLRAGFFALAELLPLPLVGDVVREVTALHPGLAETRVRHEANRRLIDRMVQDLVRESRRRIAERAPRSVADVRATLVPLVGFSPGMAEAIAALRAFLQDRMYRHYKVNRMTLKARRLVKELVEAFMAAPQCLPDRWRSAAGEPGSRRTATAVRDYIAGMTDRYALDEHDRLFRLTRHRE
jgi:dGTPase